MGVFIGATPTIPFHMLIALALASVFRLSRVMAIMGCWISNPLTIPVFYYFGFKIGEWLLFPGQGVALPATFNLLEILRLGWRVNLALQMGGVIIALPIAVVAFFLTYWGILRYRARISRKPKSALRLTQSPVPPSGTEA